MKRKIFLVLVVSAFLFIGGVKAEKLDSIFDELAPHDTIILNAIPPKNSLELEYYFNYYFLKKYPNQEYYAYVENCNEIFTECDLTVGESTDTKEVRKVKVVYQKENAEIKKLIDSKFDALTQLLAEENVSLKLEDLSLLNFYSFLGKNSGWYETSLSANYVKILKELFQDNHIQLFLDMRMGIGVDPFYIGGNGGLSAQYDGIIYGVKDSVGISKKNIIYIPNETENTKEAYIQAAQKRLDSYFGEGKLTVNMAAKRSELKDKCYVGETEVKNEDGTISYQPIFEVCDFPFDEIGDVTKMGDYYYFVKISNNVSIPFLIMRDSSKMEKVEYVNQDKETGITVNTSSSDIPLDTKVKVSEILEGNKEHTEIKTTLKTEKFKAFDITLTSPSLNKNITEIKNGVFEVKIPVGKEFGEKKVSAYYMGKEKLEEYPATMDQEGNVTFQTTHFSTYIIAEAGLIKDSSIPVPETVDNIKNYIVLGFISFMGIIGLLIYLLSSKKNV